VPPSGLRRHRFAHEGERRLADQDLPWRSNLLEARRDVDGVPGRKPLLRPRHHLARVDADAAGDPEPGQRVAHLHRRPACAQLRSGSVKTGPFDDGPET
jgi:hypothetical protein